MTFEGVDDQVVFIFSVGFMTLIGLCVWYFRLWNSGHQQSQPQREQIQQVFNSIRQQRSNELNHHHETSEAKKSEMKPTTSPEEHEELNCPICLDILRNAVEIVPCGHSFCGSCVIDYWRGIGTHNKILCPVDRTECHFIIPSYTLREHISRTFQRPEVPAERQQLDERIREYNTTFSGLPGFSRSWWIVGLNFAYRLIFSHSPLRLLQRVWLFVAFTAWIFYLIVPFDLLPEGALGAMYILGLIGSYLIPLSYFTFN